MSGYYHFAINYRGLKSSFILPGGPPSDRICRNFRLDLASLGLGSGPIKNEDIHIWTPGCVFAVFHDDPNKNRNTVCVFIVTALFFLLT